MVVEPDMGFELGEPVGREPEIVYPSGHPNVQRRPARVRTPEAEPQLEDVRDVPRRRKGWTAKLTGEIEGTFRALGVVDRGDTLIAVRKWRKAC